MCTRFSIVILYKYDLVNASFEWRVNVLRESPPRRLLQYTSYIIIIHIIILFINEKGECRFKRGAERIV